MEKVKESGYEFAIIKIGGGDGKDNSFYEDKNWIRNFNGVVENGLHFGFYFFVGSDFWNQKGIETAKYIYSLIHDISFDLPIYIDVESNPVDKKKETTTQLRLCCEWLENHHFYVGVYGSNISGFVDRFDGERIGELYSSWVAQYSEYEPKRKHDIWQYSSKGHVDGINGYVDLDLLYDDLWKPIVKFGFNNNVI